MMSEVPTLHPQAVRYADRGAAQSVIQKILVVVDPAATTGACIEKAARLASAYGSSIELFVCETGEELPDSWAGGTTLAQYRGIVRERRSAQLEALAAPLRATGLHVSTSIDSHVSLPEGILLHTIRSNPDLVVKDADPRDSARNALTLHTDWVLIKQVAAPLLLVRPAAWPSHPSIAVAVDPCHPADRPLALDEALIGTAGSFGRALSGKVEVLHALESPPHLPGDVVTAEARDSAHARNKAAVEHLAERNGIAPCSVHVLPGRIPDGIVELTEQVSPDVLVMGAPGRSRIQYSPATTASVVLEISDCDLLVVKAPGFVSPLLVTDD